MFVVLKPYGHHLPWLHALLPALMGDNKTAEAPARLISMFGFLWLAIRLVPPDAAWLRSRAAGALELAGQHSLPVFCVSELLAFLCSLALRAEGSAAMQVAVNLAGVSCLMATAAIVAWAGQPGRTQRPLLGEAAREPAAVTNARLATPQPRKTAAAFSRTLPSTR